MLVKLMTERQSKTPHSFPRRTLTFLACLLSALAFHPAFGDLGGYTQKFGVARADYFHGLEGDRSAELRATDEFSALERERPQDPTVLAYNGSLELLEAAHTWAFWNKHKLATEGLEKIDRSVQLAPDNLEVRFIRGATTWHLPFFYHRKTQSEGDFTYIAPHAESAARNGTFPRPLAASAMDYYGLILADRNDTRGAHAAFQAAVRIDSTSPGGRDALEHLQ